MIASHRSQFIFSFEKTKKRRLLFLFDCFLTERKKRKGKKIPKQRPVPLIIIFELEQLSLRLRLLVWDVFFPCSRVSRNWKLASVSYRSATVSGKQPTLSVSTTDCSSSPALQGRQTPRLSYVSYSVLWAYVVCTKVFCTYDTLNKINNRHEKTSPQST